MAIQSFAINGTPIEDYGLFVMNASGFLDLPKRQFATVQPVQRDGQVAVSQASYTAPRVIQMGLFLQPSSLSDRRTKLRTLTQALRGRLEITTVEDTTVACYGYLTDGMTRPSNRWFVGPEIQNAITITCFDPLWYDLTPQSVALNVVNTAYTIPVGSALTRRLRLVLNGSWSGTITATMKNSSGDTLQTMSSTFAAAATEYLEIQCDPDGPFLKSWSAGTATDRISTLGSTESYFMADPTDSPTIQIDKGTGILYSYRAYEA